MKEKHWLDFIKMKNFCSVKDTVKRMRKVIDLEKTFAKHLINTGI